MNQYLNRTRKGITKIASSLFSMVLFGVSIWAIYEQLHQHRLNEVIQSVKDIPINQGLAALGLMLLNCGMMTCYDTLAVRYLRQSVTYRKMAFAAIVSSVISNNVGFALLANSALRYRFYAAWGLTAMQVARITAFCNLSYGLGQMTVGGLVFLIEPLSVPKMLHFPISIHLLGVGCLSVVASYLVASVLSQNSLRIWKWRIPHLPLKVSIAQITISSIDWVLAAGIFYVLLPTTGMPSYPVCLGAYLLAQAAGVISNVPGGLGVFETVVLLILSPTVGSSKLIGALLAFRGIYNFIPLGISVLAFGLYELRRKRIETTS
jgi:glycosyltransferase 2 family protein